MLIGLDLDNTIVSYDDLFRQLAAEAGLIQDSATTMGKRAIRRYLVDKGLEDAWTGLQAIAYGPRILEAPPFPGVLDFFRRCRALDIQTTIVSHKSPFAAIGGYDLRSPARGWLKRHGIVGDGGLADDAVFFEDTRADKVWRITSLGCAWFIDDLPEVFADSNFPATTKRILFAPSEPPQQLPDGVLALPTWSEIIRWLSDETMYATSG